MEGRAHLRTMLSSALSMLTTYSAQDLPKQRGLTSSGFCHRGEAELRFRSIGINMADQRVKGWRALVRGKV